MSFSPTTKKAIDQSEVWAMQQNIDVLKKFYGTKRRSKSPLGKAVAAIDQTLRELERRKPIEGIALELDVLVHGIASSLEENREAISDVERTIERR